VSQGHCRSGNFKLQIQHLLHEALWHQWICVLHAITWIQCDVIYIWVNYTQTYRLNITKSQIDITSRKVLYNRTVPFKISTAQTTSKLFVVWVYQLMIFVFPIRRQTFMSRPTCAKFLVSVFYYRLRCTAV